MGRDGWRRWCAARRSELDLREARALRQDRQTARQRRRALAGRRGTISQMMISSGMPPRCAAAGRGFMLF
jgi:hypothetical protein